MSTTEKLWLLYAFIDKHVNGGIMFITKVTWLGLARLRRTGQTHATPNTTEF